VIDIMRGEAASLVVFLAFAARAGPPRECRHKMPAVASAIDSTSAGDELEVRSPSPATSQSGDGAPGRFDALWLQVPHPFLRTIARERISMLLDFWRVAYGVLSEWHGDRVLIRGQVRGIDIRASFEVADDTVSATASDPGWFWRGRIRSYVQSMLKKYLHPTYQAPPEES
jgi:hypothetical protein